MRSFTKAVAVSAVLSAGMIAQVKAEDSAGADLYRSNCAICHGKDASGNTSLGKKYKVRDLRSPEVQKATDAEWFDLISKGKKPMPPFADRLKDDQIRQVISYLRELGKKQ